jgi:Flp pilus assembly pilin Flp
MEVSNRNQMKDGLLEGLINGLISVPITYGIYLLAGSVDLGFTLVAVALTAFFTGYFTLTGGGVSYFSSE